MLSAPLPDGIFLESGPRLPPKPPEAGDVLTLSGNQRHQTAPAPRLNFSCLTTTPVTPRRGGGANLAARVAPAAKLAA